MGLNTQVRPEDKPKLMVVAALIGVLNLYALPKFLGGLAGKSGGKVVPAASPSEPPPPLEKKEVPQNIQTLNRDMTPPPATAADPFRPVAGIADKPQIISTPTPAPPAPRVLTHVSGGYGRARVLPPMSIGIRPNSGEGALPVERPQAEDEPELRGVVSGEEGVAVIRSRERSHFVGVGATLPDGWKVERITSDRVVLRRGATRRTLKQGRKANPRPNASLGNAPAEESGANSNQAPATTPLGENRGQ